MNTPLPLPVAALIPGGTEIIIILVIILVLFGGKKIPELMRGVGKGVGELQKGLDEGKAGFSKMIEPEPTVTTTSVATPVNPPAAGTTIPNGGISGGGVQPNPPTV